MPSITKEMTPPRSRGMPITRRPLTLRILFQRVSEQLGFVLFYRIEADAVEVVDGGTQPYG